MSDLVPSALPTRPIDATLSVTKAARLLGVHPNTVRAWSDAGRLRYYRINPRGDRRYRLGDLQRFLAAAENVPEGSAGLQSAPAGRTIAPPTASARRSITIASAAGPTSPPSPRSVGSPPIRRRSTRCCARRC